GSAAIAGPTAAIQNSMFGYLRAQEEQADRAGVKFLTATGQSAKGMYETFKRLADQVLYQVRYMNPYLQTHPLPSQRVAALEGLGGGVGGTGEGQPLLGPQGPAGAAGAARPDARQALWLSRAAGWGRAPLSAERHVACRALRARHLGLSLLRSARRAGADR